MTPVIPESAPFSPQQRAWLNGFFAGVFAADANGNSFVDTSSNTTYMNGNGATTFNMSNGAETTVVDAAPVEDDDFPWHDSALPMAERMDMVKEKPLERKLMAAMAQLDCGQCGYLCQSYGEALAHGKEKNIGLCVPGGKETKKKLKELIELSSNGVKPVAKPVAATKPIATNNGHAHGHAEELYTRQHPFAAKLLETRNLNKSGSQKETRLIRISLAGSGLTYEAGDSLGLWPENCGELVHEIMQLLGATGDESVCYNSKTQSLSQTLLQETDLRKPTEELLQLLADCAEDHTHTAALQKMIADDEYDDWEVVDLLLEFRSARPGLEDFVAALSPLQPRLYSISSSINACPDEVHLTVAAVRYEQRMRQRKGVASTFLADRVAEGGTVRIFFHRAPHFRLPTDLSVPVIMVGPGTGIAPFRAFLQDRSVSSNATNGTLKNWLFFGDQKKATDFLYEDELTNYQQQGVLTRLDTAFSRDGTAKDYVQHRMLENGQELWNWFNQGGYFFICGDAKRMAKDVHETLIKIVAEHSGCSTEKAQEYLQNMVKQGRYCRDVY
jgi:sulfite reductase (NADPH) flavoprotein alpha-component